MPFLVVAGIEVLVAVSGSPSEGEPTRVGESARAFDGTLRSTVRAVKRQWTFQTAPMPPADADTLRATFQTGAFVTCSGDALGGTITCEVRATDAGYVEHVEGGVHGFLRVLSLALHEV